MERRWRNTELRNPEAIYEIRKYCIERKEGNRCFKFEPSDAGYGYVHFEIFCTEGEEREINRLIDEFEK